MNPDTRVAVCCYADDAVYVVENMPLYQHHGCPITVLSPADSPALLPVVDCRMGGKRAYIGQDCLDRMRIHLRILIAEHTENHFLIHDSDSVCLSPKLPDFLYDEPDTLWSNLVHNGIPEQQPGFPPGMPHIAFQPPWFMSRKTIKALLDVSEGCTVVNPILPFIDYWMVEMAIKGGIPWKPLPLAMSAPLSHDIWQANAEGLRQVRDNGFIFLHSIKGSRHAKPFVEARAQYVKDHP